MGRLVNDDYMTAEQCCKWLGVGQHKLRALRKQGVIPEFWLGGNVRFSKKAIDEVIQGKLMRYQSDVNGGE